MERICKGKVGDYRDSAPGEAIDCEAGGYAYPAITAIWGSLFSYIILFVYSIEIIRAREWGVDGLSGHLLP